MSDDQVRTLPFDQADAERKLLPWWGLIGREPSYPVDTSMAASLLIAVEYDTSPDALFTFVAQHAIPTPAVVDGVYSWSACDVLAAGYALEHRRRWVSLSQLHRHKMTLGEWARMTCEASGQAFFTDLADHDLDELLGLLIKVAGDVSAVGLVAEAIRAKFREQEGLSDE